MHASGTRVRRLNLGELTAHWLVALVCGATTALLLMTCAAPPS
jgi:hypothetical protein